MTTPKLLYYTEHEPANRLLANDPLALLIGLVLYQQVPIEKAFAGPLALTERLGVNPDDGLVATAIAAMDPQAVDDIFRERPALHRFPGSMAKRAQALCAAVVDDYGGDPTNIWAGTEDAKEVIRRLKALPGFGDYKAKVYFGVLSERFGVRPDGWEDYLPTWPSIVDIVEPGDLEDLKERKRAYKASKK